MKHSSTKQHLLFKIVFRYRSYRFYGLVHIDNALALIARMDNTEKLDVLEFLKSLGFTHCQEILGSFTIDDLILGYHTSTHTIVFSGTFQSKYTIQLTNEKISLQCNQPLFLQTVPLIGNVFNKKDVFHLQDIALYRQQNVFIVHAYLQIMGEVIPIVVDTTKMDGNRVGANETKDDIQWLTIHKGFAIITLNRVGFKMAHQMLYVYIDVSFALSFLLVDIIGLYLGTDFPKFTKFGGGLQGLSITYQSAMLAIGGSFVARKNNYYEGSVLLSIKQFTFIAIGIYQKETNGIEHVFIHAMLSYPLGGAPCFYVTGIAVGVGVRYRLMTPQLHEIGTFPLIENLTLKKTDTTSAVLKQLEEYLSPDSDGYFITIGLQFTTFGVVQTNAIVNIELKPKFNITLLGKSSFNFPDKQALVHATLHFRALYNQQDGVVKIEGALQPDSYLFDTKCKLTGGFAVYMWFSGSHAHDFVITIGGYHPAFPLEQYPHYPKASRIGINWQIDSCVSITGNGYFALTSSCLMAGGNLSLIYQSGRVKAWVIAYADFLIQWQPWHYDIRIGVSVGASYRMDFLFIHKTFTIELGASLHIWGPDFAGTARISWWIISFTISFGNQQKKTIEVGFDKVEDLLAPRLSNNASQEYCKVEVETGLIDKVNDVTYIIDSEKVDIKFHCSVPIGTLTYFYNQKIKQTIYGKQVHVLPMGNQVALSSTVSINVESLNPECALQHVIMEENVPFALWGDTTVTSPEAKMITGVLTGIHLVGKEPVKNGILPVQGTYQIEQLYAPIVCQKDCCIDIKEKAASKEYDLEMGTYENIKKCFIQESPSKHKLLQDFNINEEITNFSLYHDIYHGTVLCKETGKR